MYKSPKSILLNEALFWTFKRIFEALIKRISKKEENFAIILFYALSKSGVVYDDFQTFIFYQHVMTYQHSTLSVRMFGILQLAALLNIVTVQQKKYYKPVPDIAKL